MSDIVERLRVPVMLHSNPEQTNAERREAADEIERLTAENAELRAALQIWMQGPSPALEGK